MRLWRSVKAPNREKQFKITLYLSQQAKENLEKLRLKLLDKQGRKPADSQIVEGLLRAAFKNEVETPYPVKRRPK
jgi:hypothetical protein